MEATTTTTTQEVLRLESETCGRCGGTGHYSYCQSYGTTCFKCAGNKRVFTKRGAAANVLYASLLSKRGDQLVVGDKIWMSGPFSNGWETVISAEPEKIETNKCVYNGFGKDTMYRVATTRDKKVEAMREAIKFQETLTKQGKPRKVRT